MFPQPIPGRTLTKICGITRLEDALLCADAGADAIGVNFYPPSKRYHPFADAAQWLGEVPRSLVRVAVFVNETAGSICRVADSGLVDVIQLHGDETPEFCAQIREATGLPLIRAVAVRHAGDLASLTDWPADALLLDAYAPGVYGGTGHPCDWPLAAEAVRRLAPVPLLLSGGLTPENTAAAIAAVHPAGIDVASGAESAPGIKDPDRTRALIAAASLPGREHGHSGRE